MQWTGDRNAGFSRADPARLFAPPVMDPVYGYQAINVEAQERSPSSLLNWMRRMLRLRRQHPTLGRGTFDPIATNNRRVLAFVREDSQQQILVVANMARTAQPVSLDLQRFQGRYPVELIGNTELPVVTGDPYFLTLAPHGFFWFQLAQVSKPIVLQRPRLQGRDEPVPKLLVSAVWESLLDSHTRTLLERDALIGFLSRQRWYAAKARQAARARFADWTLLDGAPPIFLCIAEVEYGDDVVDRYALVLAAVAGEAANQVVLQRPASVLARLSGARTGVLYDGMTDPAVAKRVMDLMRAWRHDQHALGNSPHRVQLNRRTAFRLTRVRCASTFRWSSRATRACSLARSICSRCFAALQTGREPRHRSGADAGQPRRTKPASRRCWPGPSIRRPARCRPRLRWCSSRWRAGARRGSAPWTKCTTTRSGRCSSTARAPTVATAGR